MLPLFVAVVVIVIFFFFLYNEKKDAINCNIDKSLQSGGFKLRRIKMKNKVENIAHEKRSKYFLRNLYARYNYKQCFNIHLFI